MTDDIVSESDIEIVHGDGTVTDKRDGERRAYQDHVARFIGAVYDRTATAADLSRPIPNRRRGAPVAYALAAASGAGAVLVVVELVRWVR